MKTITKSQLKALIEQAVAAQIPLGSKANRPQLEEQAQHRWNKTRKMDADFWALNSENQPGDIECQKCDSSGVVNGKRCGACNGYGFTKKDGKVASVTENRITKSQLQRMIQRIVKEQVHGGDFAAWGDDEEAPAPAARPETSAPAPSEVSTSKMPKVGDIFVSNWGYEQTNIDFYKIVAVSKSGGPGVKVVKLGKVYLKQKPGQDYQVPVMPDKDNERSGAVAKRITKNGSIKINDYAWAYPWDGKEEFETASGYGH